jgi:hypothetical protein
MRRAYKMRHLRGRCEAIDCLQWENVMRGMIRTILKLHLCPDLKVVERQRSISVGSPTTTNLRGCPLLTRSKESARAPHRSSRLNLSMMSPIVIVLMAGFLVRCKAVSPCTTVLNGRGAWGKSHVGGYLRAQSSRPIAV